MAATEAAPFEGIKVVDFGRYIAGPFAAALLADMGADVIRVEKRDGREDRTLISLGENEDGSPREGALFLQMNRNKRSLTIDPRAIVAVATAFGIEGPYANRVGFDGIAQAMSGAVQFAGTEEQPVRAAAPWVDFGTASLLALGISAALRAREQTGKGQLVEGALLRTALTFFSPTLIEEDALKINRIPSLNRSQTAGPSDIFK